MRFDDVDADGHPIRLVRCPKCAQIVARVYGDIEVRYRSVAQRTRTEDHLGVTNAFFFLDSTSLDEVADGIMSARCSQCKIGYDVRDVADTARQLVRTDRRSSKLRPRRATL